MITNTLEERNHILGCYVSSTAVDSSGPLFREYIWGIQGICGTLKKLKYRDYGKDVIMILFQFYVNPIPYEQQNLKEVESFRKKERSIGVPIIINNENFFIKSEAERFIFLKESIFKKLDILEQLFRKKKLDTKMDLLKDDLKKILG